MEAINFVAVPAIVTVVYTIISLLKKETKGNEKILSHLPIIAAVLGAILGVIGFYLAPSIIPANDIFTSILIGGASGLAATGTNQIFKQLASKDEKEEDKTDDSKGK